MHNTGASNGTQEAQKTSYKYSKSSKSDKHYEKNFLSQASRDLKYRWFFQGSQAVSG